MVALMGPSGSGKTSVTHAACGLLAPAWGTIEVGGGPQEVPDRHGWARLRRQTIGVVHQRLDLLSTLALMGVVVASTVAGAATVGAVAAHRRQRSALELNGAGQGWAALVAAGTMAGPGLVATVLVGLASPGLTTPGTSWAASAGLCLIIPVLVAITITGMTPDGNLPDTTRWRRATRLGLGLGLVLVAPIMVLPLLALVVGRAVNAWGTTAPQPGRAPRCDPPEWW